MERTSFYRQFYEQLGVEMCTALDVALAKGGNEAVVESYYSVMKTNSLGHHMSNETLSLRTIVDWCLPEQQICPATVAQAAMMHVEGDQKFDIQPHNRQPFHTDKRGRGIYAQESKVLTRKKNEIAKLPFLLNEEN